MHKEVKRGFNLIELIIIIAMCAVFFVIAVPSFQNYQKETKLVKVKDDLKIIRNGLEAFYRKNRRYPAVDNYQTILIDAFPNIVESKLYDHFSNKFPSEYIYSLSDNNPMKAKYYIVYSVGQTDNGIASVTNEGRIIVSNSPIWESNGSL